MGGRGRTENRFSGNEKKGEKMAKMVKISNQKTKRGRNNKVGDCIKNVCSKIKVTRCQSNQFSRGHQKTGKKLGITFKPKKKKKKKNQRKEMRFVA
jgi:hypothetical protein